jgi:hypothetical protein
VLSIDAAKTLLVDGDAVIRAADEAAIAIVGRDPEAKASPASAAARPLWRGPAQARTLLPASEGGKDPKAPKEPPK